VGGIGHPRLTRRHSQGFRKGPAIPSDPVESSSSRGIFRAMPLVESLKLDRCPHCRVDQPNLACIGRSVTSNSEGGNRREWGFYACFRCGGVVTGWAPEFPGFIEPLRVFPGEQQLDNSIPERARTYLNQARSTIHAPAGAVILAASSVDAMLKNKGYTEGSLYSRIDKAAEDHLITSEMAAWAHEIRLDANDERHADENAPLASVSDAEKTVEFSTALAQFLFVLPARVERGRKGQTTAPRT